jgi:Rrf2 family protein
VSLQVSATADYALRALLVLAAEKPATPVTARAIATEQQIPLRYLWDILVQLRNAGLVVSLRGNEGGYWLTRDPHDVTVADVIQAVDGPLLQPWPKTRSEPGGRAKHLGSMWLAAHECLLEWLASVTLADLRDGDISPRVPPPQSA